MLRGPVKRPRSTVQVEEAVGRRPSPLAAFSARDPTVCLPTHNQPQLEHTGTQHPAASEPDIAPGDASPVTIPDHAEDPWIPAFAGQTKRQTTPQCIPLPQPYQHLTPDFASAFRSPFNLPYPLPHPPRRAAAGECTVRGGQMGGVGAFPPWARLGSAPQKRRPARRFGKPIVPRPFGLTLKLIRGRAASGCCPPKGRQRRGKQRPGPTPPEAQARATVRP